MTRDSVSTIAVGESAAALDTHALVREHVDASTVGLVQHYGLSVASQRPIDGDTIVEGPQAAGIIGFVGADFRGTLAIRTTHATLRASDPSSTARQHPSYGDWIAELANQLLGRAKNALLRHNRGFGVTPPSWIVADDYLVIGHDPEHTSWTVTITQTGPVVVMVELHVRPGAVPSFPEDCERGPSLTEGELVLF